MKKTILLALAAVLMLCGLSVSVCADEAVLVPENGGTVILPIIPGEIIKPSVKGDLNVDGVVDQKDVDLFAKYFAGWKISAGDIRLSAGDVNGDGDVTRADAMELARKVAGWTERDSAIYIKKTEESHIAQGMYEYEGTTQLVDYANNQLFLVVKENTDKKDVEELIKRYNGRIVGQISGPGYYQIEFPVSYDIDKLQKLESEFIADAKIENAFINLISYQSFDASVDEYSYANAWFPDDSFGIEKPYANEKYYNIWHSQESYNQTWGLRAANVPQAWYLASKYGTPVLDTKIAVIDNTFDASHEDLDILVGIEDEGTSEKVNHGTHVAGIIGAKTNNGTGTAGIARMSNLIGFPAGKKIETSEWIAYLAAAIECECNVINVSLGSEEYNPVSKSLASYWAGHLADILDYYIDGAYDFLITTSAGNIGDESHDVNYNNAITKLAETRYRDHILVVGNAEIVGFNSYQRYYNSNYAGNRVDIMAPGTNIYSTYNYGQYGYLTGTSMASPFVAGVAALIKENVNSLPMTTIREIILSTANIDVNDSDANMINAEEAMRETIRRKTNTLYLKENDLREVKIRFVDKNNNGTLKADKIYLDIYGYAGSNDFAESGTYGEEYKLTHVVTLNGNENYSEIDTLYLNDGVYEIQFYTQGNNEYYDSGMIYLNVTANTKTLWINLPSAVPPVETGFNITGTFVYLNDVNEEIPVSSAVCTLIDVTNSNMIYDAVILEGKINGTFTMSSQALPKGTYTLHLYGGNALSLNDIDSKGFYSDKVINNVVIAGDIDLGKIYCDRVAFVSCAVTTEDNKALNNVGMTITQNGMPVMKIDRFYHGFNIALKKGNYTLTLTCEGYIPYTATFTVNGTTNLGTIQLTEGAAQIIASGKCGQEVYWEVHGSTLRIYGSGAMTTFTDSGDQPWHEYGNTITFVNVEDGVTEISPVAFALMRNLEKIRFGKDVSIIGVRAFTNCTNLKEVWFTGNVPTLNRLGIYYNETLFGEMMLTAYYPYYNETWTETARNQYGVNVRWSPVILIS